MMIFKNASIFSRIFIALISLCSMLACILGLSQYNETKSLIEKSLHHQLNEALYNSILQLKKTCVVPTESSLNWIETTPLVNHYFANHQLNNARNKKNTEIYLRNIIKRYPQLIKSIHLMVSNIEKLSVTNIEQPHDNPINETLATNLSQLQDKLAHQSKAIIWHGPFLHKNEYVLLAGKLKQKATPDHPKEIIIIQVSLSDFITSIEQIKLLQQPIVWLVDRHQRIISSPTRARLYDDWIAQSKMENQHTLLGLIQLTFRIQKTILKKQLSEIVTTLLITLAIIICIALLIAYWVAKEISYPFKILAMSASKVSHGEFDQTIPYLGGAEIGKFTQAFNTMLVHLQYREDQLRTFHENLEQDITARTSELMEVQFRYSELIDNIDGIVWEADVALQFLFISKQAQKILGFEPEYWLDYIHPEDICHFNQAVSNTISLEQNQSIEYRVKKSNGQYLWVHDTFSASERAGDTILRGIIINIDTLKQSEINLQIAEQKEKAANRAKSTFLANMSHEIRTPMNAILGYTQILKETGCLPPKQKKQLDAIHNAGNHLLGLINDILDISKIESGMMTINVVEFSLESLLEGMTDIFTIQCQQKKLTWHENIQIIDSWVFGDNGKIRQILINLLGNAIKFTHIGVISLSVRQENKKYHFAVQDSGKGIDPDEIKTIFEPFKQDKEGLKHGGTGLGLSIAQHQIQLMEGQLNVVSHPNKGSLFSFTLTLEKALNTQSKNHLEIHSSPPILTKQFTALVVDDIKDNRQILQHILQKIGAKVVLANEGEEAIEAMNKQIPDIIYMDIRMPIMDGVTALKIIKHKWPDIAPPCLAVTASSLKHQREYYLETGFDDFIAKPFKLEQIYQSIYLHLPKYIAITKNSKTPPKIINLQEITLPQLLFDELNNAITNSSITKIKPLLETLKQLGIKEQQLACQLQEALCQYDMESMLNTLNKVNNSKYS